MSSSSPPFHETRPNSYFGRLLGRSPSSPTKPDADPGGGGQKIKPDPDPPDISFQERYANCSSSKRPPSEHVARQYSTSPQNGLGRVPAAPPPPRDSLHVQRHSNLVKTEPVSALRDLSLDDPNKTRNSQVSDSMRYSVKRSNHDGEQPYPNKHCRSSASPFSSPQHQHHHPTGSFRTRSPAPGIQSSHQTPHTSPQMPYSHPQRSTPQHSSQPPHQVNLAALKEAERRHLLTSPPTTVVYDAQPEEDIKMLLQPHTRRISQEQLVNEVKGIYAGLVMVEKKCVEICVQQSSQPNTKLSNEQWQALIALHRTLLHEHHDFFLASQHPTASLALRRLPTKYAMPARMWRHGIHSFLELLRHRLPQSLEHMMSFVYLAYQMMGLLMESVPAFYETWIECLGDLARYRMAIEEADAAQRENWSNVARMWYNRAADRSPLTGRIQHHLAVLARPNVIRQLFHYSKSLTSVIPFVNARDSIMLLFTQFLEPSPTGLKYTRIENSLVTAAAIVFTRGSVHQYIVNMLEFSQELEIQFTRSGTNFKVVGAEISCSLGSLILDIGSDDNFLFNAFRTHQNKLKGTSDAKPTTPNTEPTPVEDPLLKEKLHHEFWQAHAAADAAQFPQAQPHRGDRPDAKFESSEITSYVLPVWSTSISTIAQKVGDRNGLPFLHITLAFIWSLSYIPGALFYLENYVPWVDLVLCLNTLGRSGVSDSRVEATQFPQQQSGTGLQLPEDFLMRGLIWAPYYFPSDFFQGQIVDEDERTLELPSHSAPRAERCLWLGHKIASLNRYIAYDMRSKEFSVTKHASLLAARSTANTLRLEQPKQLSLEIS